MLNVKQSLFIAKESEKDAFLHLFRFLFCSLFPFCAV